MATVAVVIFGWIVLSNHCALAELLAVKAAPVSTEQVGCCNHHPAPAEGERPCPSMPEGCCKSLTVVVPDSTKIPVASFLELCALPDEWMLAFIVALPEPPDVAVPTGPPPDAPAFVELVLNRSLLSHAPPSAA
jgi:hypothetical protein